MNKVISFYYYGVSKFYYGDKKTESLYLEKEIRLHSRSSFQDWMEAWEIIRPAIPFITWYEQLHE